MGPCLAARGKDGAGRGWVGWLHRVQGWGGGDEGGSEQRVGLPRTCGFPWPQLWSSTQVSSLSFGPHLLMRVPPVC